MRVTATELNKHPGRCITQAMKEPLIIEKAGQPAVVMVPYDHYIKLEDAYWGELTNASAQDPSLSVEESMAFLLSDK